MRRRHNTTGEIGQAFHLARAIQEGNPQQVKAALDAGIVPTPDNYVEATDSRKPEVAGLLANWAVQNGHRDFADDMLAMAIGLGMDVRLVKTLCEAGANPNARTRDEPLSSSMHNAVFYQRDAEVLIELNRHAGGFCHPEHGDNPALLWTGDPATFLSLCALGAFSEESSGHRWAAAILGRAMQGDMERDHRLLVWEILEKFPSLANERLPGGKLLLQHAAKQVCEKSHWLRDGHDVKGFSLFLQGLLQRGANPDVAMGEWTWQPWAGAVGVAGREPMQTVAGEMTFRQWVNSRTWDDPADREWAARLCGERMLAPSPSTAVASSTTRGREVEEAVRVDAMTNPVVPSGAASIPRAHGEDAIAIRLEQVAALLEPAAARQAQVAPAELATGVSPPEVGVDAAGAPKSAGALGPTASAAVGDPLQQPSPPAAVPGHGSPSAQRNGGCCTIA